MFVEYIRLVNTSVKKKNQNSFFSRFSTVVRVRHKSYN